jgi:hypothetical protein
VRNNHTGKACGGASQTRSGPALNRKTVEKARRAPLPDKSSEDCRPLGAFTRTRRLLMAALRVWELKHGIRDWPYIFSNHQ